jgi:mycothiol synthase
MQPKINVDQRIGLPEGFTDRGATMEDTESFMRLQNRWSRQVTGHDEVSDPRATANRWRMPGFDPGRDIRLVFTVRRRLAGAVLVWPLAKPPVHPWLGCWIDPDFEDTGVAAWLLDWAGQRCAQLVDELPAAVRLAPRTSLPRQAESMRAVLESQGYRHIRTSYTMQIEMEAPPPQPEWPEGITIRTYDPDRDLAAVYRADNEAFRDHFGHVEEPYEQGLERFKHYLTGYEGFDPSLWFLAMDGDDVAGISLCKPGASEDPEIGWVDALAVRRPWRKRGLGLALLRHSFAEYYRRGRRKVGLGVDAENLTGALRLYERAGMHIHEVFDLFEKEMRGGREFSVESL